MPVGLRKTNSRQSLAQTPAKASSQSKSKGHRKQRSDVNVYFRAAGVVACLLLLLPLVFWSHSGNGVSATCETTSSQIGLEHLANLQQRKLQTAWLQAEVDQVLGAHLSQNTSLHPPEMAMSHAITQPLILFIGVVSDSATSRQLAREGWIALARTQPGCKVQFVTQGNQTSYTEDEQVEDDTLYVQSRSVIRRTLFLMQFALLHFDVQFIMKASDDIYINVPNLVHTLQLNCNSTVCNHEHVYFGSEIKNTSVPLTKGGNKPEANLQYFKTTHLKTFLPYMSGIGYAVSSDLAHVLVDTEHKTKADDFLTELNDADMTIGFWLITLDTHRIDHPGIIDCPQGACFQLQSTDRSAAALTANITSTLRHALWQPSSAWNKRAILKPITDVCNPNWLLMHPISQQHEVDYIQLRLQQCKAVYTIQDASVTNAAHHKTTCQAHLPHGKVHRISRGNQQQQFLLGSETANPWSNVGTSMLAMKPRVQESKLGLGLLKVANTSKDDTWYWEHLDTTSAWNLQQGPQLQWLGGTDRYIVFNDGSCQGTHLIADSYCTVIFDIQRLTRLRVLPLPVAALSVDGSQGLHVSYERQNHATPGLGYTVTVNRLGTLGDSAPNNDGLWLMDMYTGKAQLILSLQQLARLQSDSVAIPNTLQAGSPSQSCYHWLSKPQFNPEGNSIAILHHTTNCTTGESDTVTSLDETLTASVELVTLSVDNNQVWVLPLDGVTSFAYGRWSKLLVSNPQGLYEADVGKHSLQKLKPPATVAWTSLNHCSYHQHSERHILAVTNSWPQKEVAIWDRWTDSLHTVGLYSTRKEGTPFLYAGLHPMWSPDGCSLAFDSTHTGQGWQRCIVKRDLPSPGISANQQAQLKTCIALLVFIAGISKLEVHPVIGRPAKTPSQDMPALQPKRRILLDVGCGTGAEIGRYLAADPSQRNSIQVHAFEPNPVHLQHLKAALARHDLMSQVTVHEAAAWIADEQVTLHKVSDRGSKQLHQQTEASHGLMSSVVSSLVYSVAGKLSLLNARMSIFGDADNIGDDLSVQAVDFSKWLLQNVNAQDHVVLKMDVAGAEFDVLQRMVVDGSIMLIDEMDITWHEDLRPGLRDWPLMYEHILQRLSVKSSIAQHELQHN